MEKERGTVTGESFSVMLIDKYSAGSMMSVSSGEAGESFSHKVNDK